MEWTRIDEENKPIFGNKYLLGTEKKNWFSSEKVFFGWLHEITITPQGEIYIYQCEKRMDYGDNCYSYTSNITHFIELGELPTIKK